MLISGEILSIFGYVTFIRFYPSNKMTCTCGQRWCHAWWSPDIPRTNKSPAAVVGDFKLLLSSQKVTDSAVPVLSFYLGCYFFFTI